MNDIATTLKECHKIVWDARKELEPYFKTPNARSSVRFAMCESTEALDAEMRQDTSFSRNNVKEMSVTQELAQCMMMHLTAIGADVDCQGAYEHWVSNNNLTWSDEPEVLDSIVVETAKVLKYLVLLNFKGTWRITAWGVCAEIALFVGTSIVDEMTACMERLKAKHIPGYAQARQWGEPDEHGVVEHVGEPEPWKVPDDIREIGRIISEAKRL